jgi:hypothetical protein
MLQIATGTTYQLNDSRVAGSGCFFSFLFWLLERGLCNFIYDLLNKLKKQTRPLGFLTEKRWMSAKKKRCLIAQNPCSNNICNHLPKILASSGPTLRL